MLDTQDSLDHLDRAMLDEMSNRTFGPTKILVHERMTVEPPAGSEVVFIQPVSGRFFRFLLPSFFLAAIHALRVLRACSPADCIVCNGGEKTGKLVGVFNSLFFGGRKNVVMWECFAGASNGLRGWGVRKMVDGCKRIVVYSKRLRQIQADLQKTDISKFVFIPYKANHSKSEPISLEVGNYVFAGGNSSRDYDTLFRAVEGTGIPVVISTTRSDILNSKNVPENVVLLSAREPYFARLMAGSRLVVLPVESGLVFGQAVASISNAMWHGKVVIGADDGDFLDYIEDGKTGYVVPSGDAELLRQKINLVWKDDELLNSLAKNANQLIRTDRTHEIFLRRVLTLALSTTLTE